MIAMPLALISLSVIMGSIYASQSYVAASSRYNYEIIRDYGVSGQIIMQISAQQSNYTAIKRIILNISAYYGVAAQLEPISEGVQCAQGLCRIVQVGANSWLLVLK